MLYVVIDVAQKSWWSEYGCRYVLALMKAGVPLRMIPEVREIVERTAVPEEFHPILDTMLGAVESCTKLLYVGDPAGATALASRGPGELPDERYALVTWPTDTLPPGLVAGLNCYDRVLVPSEECAKTLRNSGVQCVAVVSPPDPPRAAEGYSSAHPTVIAMGAWEGYGCLKTVLHAFVARHRREDNVMLHLACPDAPFDDARGLAWECASAEAAELPLVSLSHVLPSAAERAEMFSSCRVYASATRRLDFDPFAREALRHGCNVVTPAMETAGLSDALVDDRVWFVPFLPCGAEECDVHGVGFDQMWGDVDALVLGDYIAEALQAQRRAAVPERSHADVGAQLASLLTPDTGPKLESGEVAIRVVVPHKNRGADFVVPCLDALRPQLGPKDSVVLVDQESRPEVLSQVMTYCFNAAVPVVPSASGPEGAWSLASARNAGAVYDDGRPFSHVFFLDCDCVVPEGFVEALRARLEANQGGIVMPIVCDSKTKERRPATGLAAVNLAHYKALGGYDEGYFGWGSEDIDFLWRARKRLAVEGDLMTSHEITHLHHEPCEGQDEHAARNTQRFMAMAGEGGA
jgi:hypothetical protein